MQSSNYFFDILLICDQQFVIVHNLANSVMVITVLLFFLGSLLTNKNLSKESFRAACGMMAIIGFSILLNWYSLQYLKEKISLNNECFNKALQYEPFVKTLPHL